MKIFNRYIFALGMMVASVTAVHAATPDVSQLPDSLYLMAYFKSPAQHLFYAWSTDGLNWKEANDGKPIFTAFDDSVWMRDPFLNRVKQGDKETFHLVHTWGWDNPAIFHWQSDDLIHWTAADGSMTTESGKIFLMDGKEGHPEAPNAWAPEFTYVPEEDLFYVYWSSCVDNRMLHHVTTTRDWKTFSTSQPFFDPGFTAIDLTIAREGDTFYGYYKDERNGEKTILIATTSSLDPGKGTLKGTARLLPEDYNVEVEGPSIFSLVGGNGWIGYFDKFNGDAGLSFVRCTNLEKGDWQLVPDAEVSNVPEVKHGSVIIVSRDEILPLITQ